MRFDYGGVNRWCPDNKHRRGRFIASFDGPLFEKGTMVNFATDSLFIDNDLAEVIMDSEFLGPDNAGKHQLTFHVSKGLIMLDDTVNVVTLEFQPDYLLTWEEGQQTMENHGDDMFLVTGSSRGMNRDNTEFEVVIQDPLINYLDCFWIVSGTHQISVLSAEVSQGTIDYISVDDCFYQVDFYFGDSQFYDYLKY